MGLANDRAIALYERHGFRRVAVQGSSCTMLARLGVRRVTDDAIAVIVCRPHR